jgi:hypothetical protein
MNYDPLHAITARPEFTKTCINVHSPLKNTEAFRKHRAALRKSLNARYASGVILYSSQCIADAAGVCIGSVRGYGQRALGKQGRFTEKEYQQIFQHFGGKQ